MLTITQVDSFAQMLENEFLALKDVEFDKENVDELKCLLRCLKDNALFYGHRSEFRLEVSNTVAKTLEKISLDVRSIDDILIFSGFTKNLYHSLMVALGNVAANNQYGINYSIQLVDKLLENRDVITEISDSLKDKETKKLNYVNVLDCNITSGFCSYISEKTKGITDFENGVVNRLHKEYCRNLKVGTFYPICLGNYDAREAERQFDTNLLKWDSSDYGQARWEHVINFKKYLESELLTISTPSTF